MLCSGTVSGGKGRMQGISWCTSWFSGEKISWQSSNMCDSEENRTGAPYSCIIRCANCSAADRFSVNRWTCGRWCSANSASSGWWKAGSTMPRTWQGKGIPLSVSNSIAEFKHSICINSGYCLQEKRFIPFFSKRWRVLSGILGERITGEGQSSHSFFAERCLTRPNCTYCIFLPNRESVVLFSIIRGKKGRNRLLWRSGSGQEMMENNKVPPFTRYS